MRIQFALLAATAIAAGTASAADSGFYVGAGIGYSHVGFTMKDFNRSVNDQLSGLAPGDWAVTSSHIDNTANPWSLYVGYKFIPYLAAELAYIDMGSVNYTGTATSNLAEQDVKLKGNFSATAWPVSVLGIYPINQTWDVFGRVGWAFGNTSATGHAYDSAGDSIGRAHATSSPNPFIGGLGVDANFMETWAARLEWQAMPNMGTNKTGQATYNNYMFSIMYKF